MTNMRHGYTISKNRRNHNLSVMCDRCQIAIKSYDLYDENPTQREIQAVIDEHEAKQHGTNTLPPLSDGDSV